MPPYPPPSHRLSRALLAVVIAAAFGLAVAVVLLTGIDDALLRAGADLTTKIRHAWPG
jgi:hypothetical protein